jgi:glycosyltransferase involved in cell wall biosynthesis
MKLSILHLIRTLNPAMGGPIEFLKLICDAHARRGIQVKILTLDAPNETWWQNPPVSIAGCGPGFGRYGYHPQFKQRLFQEMGSFNRLIVHGLWQYHGVCASAVAQELDRPYYVFPHGMLDAWFKRAFPLKHWKKQAYWVIRERSILQHANRVLFTADRELKRGAATFWPSVNFQGNVLPLGVDRAPENTESLKREFLDRFPRLRDKRFLLFLGRLHPKKGCDLAIQAMAQLAPPIELVIAGPESVPGYSEYLRGLAGKLPVTFTGMLQAEVKWGALACADALILPSHQENFGLVVGEALAFGLPVLISNQINTAEFIAAYGAGFVEPDTLEGASRLMQRWLTADRPAARLAARSCFRDHFDIETTSERFLKILADAESARETLGNG